MEASLGLHQLTHSVGAYFLRHPLLGSGEVLAVLGITALGLSVLSSAVGPTDVPVAEPALEAAAEPEQVRWPWKKRANRNSILYAFPPGE